MSDLIEAATRILENAGIETARADAEWLLAGLVGRGRLAVYLDRDVPPATAARYTSVVRRRATGVPIQQILGWEEFRGLRLIVTPDVLVPRPETEMLVEWALELLPLMGDRLRVVDVGAGSGAIACALASERPTVQVIAIDVSLAAACVTRENSRALGLTDRLQVVEADLLTSLRPASVDLVVSNPPYLSRAMLAATPREVRDHEPHLALDGGPDGLSVLSRLIRDTLPVLRPDAALIVETAGRSQVGAVVSLFEDAGYRAVTVRPDLAGTPRFVAGRRPVAGRTP